MTTFAGLGGTLQPLGRYAIDGDTRWSLYDPSIGWSPEDGYRVVFQSSNHYLLTDGSTMLTSGDDIKFLIYIGSLSDDLEKLMSVHKLPASNYRTRQGTVSTDIGLQEARLFWRPEGWHLLGVFHEKPSVVAVGILKNGQEPVFAALQGVKGAPDHGWVPAAYGGSEGFDFILPRGRVIRQKKVVRVGEEVPELRHFFGGPPVVPLGDGTFLGVPHAVGEEKVRVYTASRMAYINGSNLRYLHRFVRYAESGEPVEMSEPWVFESGGVEKCAGLVHCGDDFALSYGRNDVSSVLGRISQRKAVKLLKRV